MKILRFILGSIPFSKNLLIYIYIGIPFNIDLSLKPIIVFMESKVQKSLCPFSSFLTKRLMPLPFKRYITQSYIISKALLFAPLFRFVEHDKYKQSSISY